MRQPSTRPCYRRFIWAYAVSLTAADFVSTAIFFGHRFVNLSATQRWIWLDHTQSFIAYHSAEVSTFFAVLWLAAAAVYGLPVLAAYIIACRFSIANPAFYLAAAVLCAGATTWAIAGDPRYQAAKIFKFHEVLALALPSCLIGAWVFWKAAHAAGSGSRQTE